MRWPPVQRRTLVIEVGMQNAGLGSVLALAHLGEAGEADPEAASRDTSAQPPDAAEQSGAEEAQSDGE